MPAMDRAEGGSNTTPTEPKQHKRRRWPRRIGFLLLLLVVVVGAAVAFLPQIASSKAVTDYGLSFANKQLQGSLELEGLSASWGGPTELRGVRVTDPEGREVIKAAKISYSGGVWRLITSTLDFGEIHIESPRVNLHMTADNELTLAQAFQPTTPSQGEPEPGGSLPAPRGKLVISNGAVHVSRADGSALDVADLNGEFKVDSLSDVAADLKLTIADGGSIALEAAITGLVSKGAFDIDGAAGSLKLSTAGDLDINPLANFAAPDAGVSGKTNLKVDLTLDHGDVRGEFATNLLGLHAAESTSPPLDLGLSGSLNMTADQLRAQTSLSGEAGAADATILYDRTSKPLDVSIDDVLATILSGGSLELPGFSVEAQANVDLAALDKAVPGLLHLQEGRRLTGGTLKVSGLSVKGGAEPVARGKIELNDVTATNDDRVVQLAPISLDFDARVETGKGLEISRTELTSGFAHVVASGAASNMRAEFQADLTRLKQQLGQIVDIGSFELAGELSGNVGLTRVGDDRVDVAAQVNASQVKYVAGDRRFDLERGNVDVGGNLNLVDGEPGRFVADKASADLNGEVVASAAGWYDFQHNGFQADLDLQQAQLGFIASRAKAFGMDELARYGGALRVQIAVARADGQQPITTSGSVLAQNLSVDGQPLVESDADVSWTGVQLAADASTIDVGQAILKSGPASLTADNVRWRSGEKLVLDGKLNGSADLASCFRSVGLITKSEEPPAIAGRLSVSSNFNTAGGKITLAGTGQIDEFAVGTGEQTVRDKRVSFDYDALIDENADRITVNSGSVKSQPLTADIAGTIDKYTSTQELSLSGNYTASWKELTVILHELAPATAENIDVTGKSSSAFKITGPLNQQGEQPTFESINSGLDVGWASAEIYGVPMGIAKLSPSLRDGQLFVPDVTIPTATGKVNLGAVIDLRTPEPILRLPKRLQILEDVTVTPELASSLLSRINPIFLHLTRVEGSVRADLRDVVLPLGESLKTAGTGSGRIDLLEMKVQPDGLLAELLALGGLNKTELHVVRVSGLDFELKDGRIAYKDFTLTFADGGFDIKFYGSVGLDETLDLVVSLPVRAALLERMGVKGPVVEYAQQLTGSRVDIPLVGTRLRPKLDLSKVDVKPLIENAIKKSTGKAADDLLRDLLAPKEKQEEEKEKKEPPRRRLPKRKKTKP